MPDPRRPGPEGPTDLFAPGKPLSYGAFDRAPGVGVTFREPRGVAAAMRVLGTEPLPAPVRRNRANSSVYVDSLARTRRPGRGALRIPVVGEIAAGQYQVTVAYHDYLDYEHGVEVDAGLVPEGSGAYALRVRGTSMTHVGIDPGDLVVVQPQDRADNGDFVIAALADSEDPEGYVTLKRFYRKHDHIFLQSATAAQEPIRLYPFGRGRGADRDRVKVQGRVIVVLKNR